jgi:hypothetical protein
MLKTRVNFSTKIIYSHKNKGMKMDMVFTIYDYFFFLNILFMTIGIGLMSNMVCPVA